MEEGAAVLLRPKTIRWSGIMYEVAKKNVCTVLQSHSSLFGDFGQRFSSDAPKACQLLTVAPA